MYSTCYPMCRPNGNVRTQHEECIASSRFMNRKPWSNKTISSMLWRFSLQNAKHVSYFKQPLHDGIIERAKKDGFNSRQISPECFNLCRPGPEIFSLPRLNFIYGGVPLRRLAFQKSTTVGFRLGHPGTVQGASCNRWLIYSARGSASYHLRFAFSKISFFFLIQFAEPYRTYAIQV